MPSEKFPLILGKNIREQKVPIEGEALPVETAEGTKVPEVLLENVTFRVVTNKLGQFVGYKSSGVDRKEVRLDPSSLAALPSGVDTDRGYRVRIIGDSNPDDPLRGFYLAEVVSDLEHRGAQKARAERLRTSSGFKTVASMLNQDPDLSGSYRAVVGRHKEFHGLHGGPEERHRNFTGMLAALMMSERGSDLLDRVIDRTTEAASDQIKRNIRESSTPPYVPGVTIGAGVYGAVLAATRQMYLPEVPDLTVEQSNRTGGQFAQYRKDLFRLNSRRRPELKDAPHLPGKQQSLNSFGTHSVLQSSDTGNESYPFQSTIADTARVNFFLSGQAVVSTELRRIRENTNETPKGKLILELFDKDTDRIIEVATDRVTLSTGIGEEQSRLDPSDTETQSILKEEKSKARRGEDAQVMSFIEFAKRMSNPAEAFPMKGLKRLVLSGEGDSANVIAGIALGYESQVGKTASQLDSIEEIVWIGQELETKEKFLENTRVRYAQIGLEFPREKMEGYYHRIKPIAGRSFRLQRTEDGVRVLLQQKPRSGFLEAVQQTNTGEYFVEGDHFVYAHGFMDTTDDIIGNAFVKEETTPENLALRLEDLRDYPDVKSSIYYKTGRIRRVDIISEDFSGPKASRLVLGVLYSEGGYGTEKVTRAEFSFREEFFELENVERIERTYNGNELEDTDLEDTEYQSVRGRRRSIAKSYTTRNGGQIYKVGPAAAFPLRPEEIEEAPALETIPQNTAAIFRYVDTVETFGERTAREDRSRGVAAPKIFSNIGKEEPRALPSVDEAENRFAALDISIRYGRLDTLGIDEHSADMLKLAVGDSLSAYRFPPELKKLELSFVRTSARRSGSGFKVLVEPTLPEDYEAVDYEAMIRRLSRDRLMGAVIKKLTDNVRSHAVTIRVPIHKGRADGAGTTFEVYRPTD